MQIIPGIPNLVMGLPVTGGRAERHVMLRVGELPYETDGNARRKFWIRPPKETKLGVAQAVCDL